ncbi:MAG: hypothetical protein H7335_13985 [Massilia sp.]|nr:hypothetical protein [Massilia sp.]
MTTSIIRRQFYYTLAARSFREKQLTTRQRWRPQRALPARHGIGNAVEIPAAPTGVLIRTDVPAAPGISPLSAFGSNQTAT